MDINTALAGQSFAASREVYVTGRRVIATIIDAIILLFVSGIAYLVANFPVANLVIAVVTFAYFVGGEGIYGQTVGKMAAGVEVISQTTGETAGLGAATVRTLLRLIDGMFFYLVAFIMVLASDKRQRLGDMAASTLVVRK